MSNALGYAGITLVLFVLAVIIFGPFLMIWSLNTLFGLTLTFTFKNWLAALVFMSLLHGGSGSSK